MKIHMVKKGDTLYFIAQKYNVPLEALIQANPEISNPDVIDVGMKVKIPEGKKPTFELMHQHTVQQGDTLWKLSKAWGIPLSVMIQANPQLKNPNVLLTGEVVNIPKVQSGGNPGNPGNPGFIPGKKKDTSVKLETGVTFEPVPEMPAIPETPVMPVPAAPAPVLDLKKPFPVNYPPEENLFAQFPVPAVEAGAANLPAAPMPMPLPAPLQLPAMQAPVLENVSPGLKKTAIMHEGFDHGIGYGHDFGLGLGHHYGMDHGHIYGAGLGLDHGMGYVQPQEFGYGHDFGHGVGGLAGIVGSIYDPKDISGSPGGFGDVSNAGQMAGSPAGTGPSGYLPAYIPGLVSPAATGGMTQPGCKTCGGGAPVAPAKTAVSPVAGEWPAPPVMPNIPMMPAVPMAPVAPVVPMPPVGGPTMVSPTMVSPAMEAPLPAVGGMMQPGMMPPSMMQPGMMQPGMMPPTMVQPGMIQPGMMQPGMMPPYPGINVYPYGAMPAYDQYGYTAGAHAYGFDPYVHGYAHGAYDPVVSPYFAHQAAEFADCGPYGVPYPVDWSGVTPVPPLPPLREEEPGEGTDEEISLHALGEQETKPRSTSVKRATKPKVKAAARRPAAKAKQSLPWIKW